MKVILCFCLVLAFQTATSAYSVLTHEALIDSVWKDSFEPLLSERYPHSTPEELLKARSYAYGGSLIQDMGYYPFGNKMFSDLIHYVRTGEFVEIMIRQSGDLNEYAFALGALSHYASDCNGHALATNLAVPILFPELRKKYGDVITYDEKPSAHIRAEFGYDVLQVARGNYPPEAYHDFIGFNLSDELLERTILEVYSLELKDIFSNVSLAKGTFRFSIRDLIPELTRVAWELKKDEIQKLTPGITKAKFLYLMPRKDFEKEWGKEYKRPGLCTRILAFFIRIIPKIGPLKSLKIKLPTPEVEKMFLESYAATVERYQDLLRKVKNGSLYLENRNLDTGEAAEFGDYERADKTYAKLLKKLATKNFAGLTPQLKDNILEYFSNLRSVRMSSKDSRNWKEVINYLKQIESIEPPAVTAEKTPEFYFNRSCTLNQNSASMR